MRQREGDRVREHTRNTMVLHCPKYWLRQTCIYVSSHANKPTLNWTEREVGALSISLSLSSSLFLFRSLPPPPSTHIIIFIFSPPPSAHTILSPSHPSLSPSLSLSLSLYRH